MKIFLSPLVPLIFIVFPVFASDNYQPINTQDPKDVPPTPEEAAALISVPKGFHVTLFAGEPDVRQPVAMQIDDRGRVWVAEAYSYKEWEMKGEDRILIFEDTDNDGRYDSRKIFYDKATHLSGLAVGFGGVWICNSPNLEFIPDRNGDDIPDGPPEVVLDGFTTKANHNFFNGLTWGLDGWLYGRHGITAPSLVGLPGTPAEERLDVDCGIWRYNLQTKAFEMVVRGTTNPWGLDWNDMGELFFTGNVNGHLWHAPPGAFYPRMHGQGFFMHVYDRIQMCADHLHHEGNWNDRKKFRDNAEGLTNEMGGGHSHCGGMIYLGDNWPDKYRNTLFASNTHGRRINNDLLVRKGSGYVGIHGEDFMRSNQPWYKGVTQIYGPDGGVFVSDWTDIGECHDNDGVHRTSGRIYKVVYGKTENPHPLNLATEPNLALARYQLHKNEWYVRHARRNLQERFMAGRDVSDARVELIRFLGQPGQPVDRQLRMLWALHATGGVGEDRLTGLLDHENEHVRSWAVRLIGEAGAPSTKQFQKIFAMGRDGKSLLVRLYIASTFPRFSESQQWTLAESLLADFGYTEDPNLPQMIWYAIQPLVARDPVRALGFLAMSHDPKVTKNIVRRIASDFDINAALMPRLVSAIVGAADRGDLDYARAGITGMENALNGLKGIEAPDNWGLIAESGSKTIRDLAQGLKPVFEDASPMTEKDWLPLLDNGTRRNQAIQELAAFDDPKIAGLLLREYRRYGREDRDATIATLSSRVSLAGPLLQAMRNGQVEPRDVSAFYARQIFNLGDDKLNDTLEAVWGKLRQTPSEKLELIETWQAKLTPQVLAKANLENGKAVFQRTCAACHSLYGEGGELGPELNGANRNDLYYVLENLIDPSAVLPRDYWMTLVTLKDGRVLNGTLAAETRHTITLTGMDRMQVIPVSEIVQKEQFEQSTMPEGLLLTMQGDEVRDLIGYLQWR